VCVYDWQVLAVCTCEALGAAAAPAILGADGPELTQAGQSDDSVRDSSDMLTWACAMRYAACMQALYTHESLMLHPATGYSGRPSS
jgi:hypothetical protein